MKLIDAAFWSESPNGRDHSEDLGIDGRMILEWIIREWGILKWMHLVQDRDQLWALVNMVMHLRIP
jgi:hypothetical protein